jgi:hypothetical protein
MKLCIWEYDFTEDPYGKKDLASTTMFQRNPFVLKRAALIRFSRKYRAAGSRLINTSFRTKWPMWLLRPVAGTVVDWTGGYPATCGLEALE